jgi:hypothetical protein
MDALTWFKSVFHRSRATPALLRADLATEQWADVPLHHMAARLRPPAAPADDAEDWDAVIARAKMQAASPKAPSPPPPPPPRNAWAEMPDTPPPSPARQAPARSMAKLKAPRARAPEATQATLDALVLGGLKKPTALRPAFAAGRSAEEDLATPLPLGSARRAVGLLFGPVKRP